LLILFAWDLEWMEEIYEENSDRDQMHA
jgi:hypothetical protein